VKLYIAFKLSPLVERVVKQVIVDHCSNKPPLVPTPLDRIHVTTLFLGEMYPDVAKDIVTKSLLGIKQFKVWVGSCNTFGGKVAYFDVGDDALSGDSMLRRMRAAQVELYEQRGHVAWPRNYEPHVTLAKLDENKTSKEDKKAAHFQILDLISDLQGMRAGGCDVDTVGLYHKSECLKEWKLP
jgi:2'-5' RNA ligase